MQNKSVNNNQVTLEGKIKSKFNLNHRIFGEGFYKFDIEIPRLSETCDIIPCLVSERLVDINEDLIGANVRIEGQYRSYNSHVGNRSKLILYVFASDFEIICEDKINKNIINLTGFVCKKPHFKITPGEREITELLVAVNRQYGNSDYIPCICWSRNAKFASNFKIGDKISLSGRIQSREYIRINPETDEVIEDIAYEVSASRIELLGENNKRIE